MAKILKESPIVTLFAEEVLNNTYSKDNDKKVELAEANREISDMLDDYANPVTRSEIAQIVGYTVDTILDTRMSYVDSIADVKRTEIGAKAEFKTELDGIQAFIQAKGSTTQRSTMKQSSQLLDTEAVSARPWISFLDLKTGKFDFSKMVLSASYKMELAMLQRIETVMYAAFANYASPNYAAGAGVVKATLDEQIRAFARLGGVSLMGDIDILWKLTALTGFNGVVSQDIINEANRSGSIGTYNSASVVKLANPPVMGSLTTTQLRKDLLYILPSGAAEFRPLKVAWEGDMMSMDANNINDRSFEIQMDKYFGAGIVFAINYMGLYEDTTL